MNKILLNISLALAVALLLCLLPMPYGYYTLIRFASMIVLACLAVSFYDQDKVPHAIVAASAALLFQPFFKIALGRGLWNIVDVITAVALIFIWFKYRKS